MHSSPVRWLIGGGMLLAGALVGAGIGQYASGRIGFLPVPPDTMETENLVGNPDALVSEHPIWPEAIAEVRPVPCKGCGPTLAERRMQEFAPDAYATDEHYESWSEEPETDPADPLLDVKETLAPAKVSE